MSRPPYLPADPNETDNLSRYAPAHKPGSVEALGAAPGLNSYKVGSAESIARRVQKEGQRAMMQDPRVQQYLATRPWDVAPVMQTGMTSAGQAHSAQQQEYAAASHKSRLDLNNKLTTETGYSRPADALAFLRDRSALDMDSKRVGAASAGIKLKTDADAYAAGQRLRESVATSPALTPEASALQTLARAGHTIDPRLLTEASSANAARANARDMVRYNLDAPALASGVAPGDTASWHADREAIRRDKATADLAKTQVDTTRASRPRDEDILDSLLERANRGDFESATKYNRMIRRINDAAGRSHSGAKTLPESAEEWATMYPNKQVPGASPAKDAAPQWSEGDLARGPDGSVRRYVGGKWVAE